MARELGEGQTVIVGADPSCDIVLSASSVSGRHLQIAKSGGRYWLRDLGSTFGTWVDGVRVTDCEVLGQSQLVLGQYATTLNVLLGQAANSQPRPAPAPPRPPDSRPSQPILQPTTKPSDAPPENSQPSQMREVVVGNRMVVIGREADCDQVVAEAAVSGQHARVFRSAGRLILEDMGSRNGTFVRGAGETAWQSVRYRPLGNGDLVRVGSCGFRFSRAPAVSGTVQACRVDVQGLAVRVSNDKTGQPMTLLRDVSFTALQGEVVGIMGPSGSGKTTLLNVLAGFDRPSAGSVLIEGVSLFGGPDGANAGMAALIGHAPQFDVAHAALTVREAVAYSARLRGAAAWDEAEIAARTDRALRAVAMAEKADVRLGSDMAKSLSGGQKKRVNIAMELVLDPPVLLLDEPTSGLSAHDTADLMRLLRDLADGGRTVLLTIHQPSYAAYVQMDQVLVLEEGGHTAYFGPTAVDSFAYFEVTDREPEALLARMPKKLSRDEPGPWARKYAQSALRERFVAGRAASLQSPPPPRPLVQPAAPLQLANLLRRALVLKSRDRFFALLNTAVPVTVAALFAAVLGARTAGSGWSPERAEVAHSYLMILAVMCCLFGALCAALEIVTELPVARRERRGGVGVGAYLTSKAILYAIPAVAFPALAVATVLALGDGALNGSLGGYVAMLAPTYFAAACAGLLASALVKSSEGVITMAVFYAIVQVVFAVFVPLHVTFGSGARSPWLGPVSAVTTSRWALSGLVAQKDLCEGQSDPNGGALDTAAAGLAGQGFTARCAQGFYQDHGIDPAAKGSERTLPRHAGQSAVANALLSALALGGAAVALRRRLG